jgi:hypothetical protein
LDANGSPPALLRTDSDRTHFYTEIKVHPEFENEPVYELITENDFFSWNDVESYINKVIDQVSNQVSNQVKDIIRKEVISISKTEFILNSIVKEPKSRESILRELSLTNQRKNYERYMYPLMELGLIEFTVPSKATSRNQKYRITLKGLVLNEILKQSENKQD